VISFFAAGIPLPKGNMTQVRRGTFSAMVDQSNMARKSRKAHGLDRWAEVVATAARAAKVPLLTGPVQLSLTFVLPRPKTVKRSAHTVKPDTSKLVRAVEDALSGIAYIDDAQVVSLVASKYYETAHSSPGVRVCVGHQEPA